MSASVVGTSGVPVETGPDAAVQRVLAHRADHEKLLRVVRGHARRGDLERVLISATAAANHAWFAPTGLLADPELERLVVATARRGGGSAWVDADRDRGRVLHVLSEGYPVGGHTRLAWRWMERDSRRADVALTNQLTPTPDQLRDVAESTGGRVFDLREAHPTLTARAQALRRLMDTADLVVLHVHPFDAVALAAANLPGPRPPILFEDHADHTFWLGLGAADVVMDHRRIAQQVGRELRGVRPERQGWLPLPIDDTRPEVTRAQMRQTLRLDEGQVAGITVASAAKMAPQWGEGLDDLHTRALDRCPELVVFVVGADATGRWERMRQVFPGRVFPLGIVPDPDLLYPAMDVYLDSFPITSSTSILEAAVAGLPPLCLQEHTGYGHLWHANSPGLDRSGHVTTTKAEYLAALDQLVADPELRRGRGRQAREDVLAVHSGAAWRADLEALYAQARSVTAADLDEYPARVEDLAYGAQLTPFMLRSLSGQDVSPPVESFYAPVAAYLDRRLQYDVQLATQVDRGRTLSVRVAPGWEDHPAWTVRLADLAGRHPHLRVSLPFVDGDDVVGSLSVGHVEAVLDAGGQSTEDCGDLNLETEAPPVEGFTVGEPLTFEPGTLDALEDLLRSPCWDELGTEG